MDPTRVREDGLRYAGALLAVLALSLVLWGAFVGALAALGRLDRFVRRPRWQWHLGWWALAVYVAWWLVFFLRDVPASGFDPDERKRVWEDRLVERAILPLPTYLDFKTVRRDPLGAGAETAVSRIERKAANTIVTVSAIVGFSLLIFSFTLNLIVGGRSLSPFRESIATVVLLVQVIAIVAFVIGMDALDTATNRFVDFTHEERYWVTAHFYRKGIYYYYRGLVVLIFSAFLSMMLVTPAITVVGVAVFAFLGYDYWFDYTDGYPADLDVSELSAATPGDADPDPDSTPATADGSGDPDSDDLPPDDTDLADPDSDDADQDADPDGDGSEAGGGTDADGGVSPGSP